MHEPEAVRRFKREAEVARMIEHPALVKVLGVDSYGSGLYIIMEYVAGRTLARILESGPLTEQRALAITLRVAEALEAVHAGGIVHRDVKPANILVTPTGDIRLMDLGLAKIIAAESVELTGSNILGTPLYMPFEQFESSKDVDARADIYSLGATLFHMLTGNPPVQGRSVLEIVRKLDAGPGLDPRQWAPGVSRATHALCLKMTARDAADRHASATEVIEAIRRCREGEAEGDSVRRAPDALATGRRSNWLPTRMATGRAVRAAALASLAFACLLGGIILDNRTARVRAPEAMAQSEENRAVEALLNKPVSLYPPYPLISSGDPPESLSLQLAVKFLANQIGVEYDHRKSLSHVGNRLGVRVRPVVRNVPCNRALRELLAPAGLSFHVESGKIVLYPREEQEGARNESTHMGPGIYAH